MTLTRRCAAAAAVVTVAGRVAHSTSADVGPTGAVPRHVPPLTRTHRTPGPHTQSPGARSRAAADPSTAATAPCAEAVNSRERPGLRKSWTWVVRSPRVTR